MKNKIERAIERDIAQAFPGIRGLRVKFDGFNFDYDAEPEQDFYHLYPGMTRENADKQRVEDTVAIIRKHIPSFRLRSYEQHGKVVEV